MNEPKKHILILSAWYPSEEDPMFGLFVQNYARMLARQYQVTVLFYNSKAARGRKKSISVQSKQGFTEVGIHYYSSNKIFRFIGMLSGMYKGYKLIRRRFGKPDLTHVQILTRMAVFARVLQICQGIPFVITEHWSRYLPEHFTYKGLIRKIITQRVVKKSHGVSAVCNYLATHMQNAGLLHKKPYFILYNVVDAVTFKLREMQKTNNIKQIIHVSCFENASKNILGMLDAFFQLRKIRNDFNCVLVGTGDDFDMCYKYAEKLQILDFVKFEGGKDPAGVAQLMGKSSFYLQNSNYENLPVVIAEALTCGLPVVSTNVGGIPEMVNSSNGILVQKNNTDELVKALDLMLDKCNSYSAEEIRKNAVNNYSEEAVLKRFNTFYHEALGWND